MREEKIFLLTRPSRDVTQARTVYNAGQNISTHTSLAGRDRTSNRSAQNVITFLLTRPPRDVTKLVSNKNNIDKFLLTRPSRDVTKKVRIYGFLASFLLTRPSRDVTAATPRWYTAEDFYSHVPRGT